MDMYESLYILGEEQKQHEQHICTYDFLFCGLLPNWRHNNHWLSFVRDVAFLLYEEQEPVINSNITMIYLIRKEALTLLANYHRIGKLKAVTKGSFEKSILAAVQVTNGLLKILEDYILPELTMAERQLFGQFSNMDIRFLFSEEYTKYEEYPKQLVYLQTKIIKNIARLRNQHPEVVEDMFSNVIRFMDLYTLTEQDVFEKMVW